MTVKPDNLKSLLTNNNSNLHKKAISAEFLSNTKSDISVIYFFEAMKKILCKRK